MQSSARPTPRFMTKTLWAVVCALWWANAGAARALPSDPELAALTTALVPAGRSWVEKPRVLKPLRPEQSIAQWRFELPVPIGRQLGDKTNCGPTAAAMALGAYQGVGDPAGVRVIRDVVGEWSWQAFPMRQMRLPGYDAGITTRHMMKASLERFEPSVGWSAVEHPWLPLEAWSVIALKQAVAERRPMMVLAEAKQLWGMDVAGLHWVVVRGFDAGRVVFNDPADGTVARIPFEQFWSAWRLPDLYRGLPMVAGFEALVPDRSLPPTWVAAARIDADALAPL